MAADSLRRLSVAQKLSLKSEFEAGYKANTADLGNCHLWLRDQSRYPKYWVSHLQRQIPVHKLVFFLYRGRIPVFEGDEVSHLCGNERCCNVNHLTIEPHEINMERKKCHGTGLKKGEYRPKECPGHTKPEDVLPRRACIM